MTAKYETGLDVFDTWRDALFSGTAPPLYSVGAGAFANVEIGPGRVVILGGAPGTGKTALTTQWVVDALRATPELRAVITNIEMTPGVLLDRALARLSGVHLDIIAKRQVASEHAERIDCALATLEAIADRLAFLLPPFNLDNLAEAADDFGGELLLVDYLQRVHAPGEHSDKRGGVDALMNYLRQFASAGCAVLGVSAVARTKDKRGRSTYDGDGLNLASFRESSELEFGADQAFVLMPSADDPEAVMLRCLKHRHGEPRDVALNFERRIQNFHPVEATPATVAEQGRLTTKLRNLWASTPAADSDE